MTKLEPELQDIEHRLRLIKTGKKAKVHPAEIEFLEIERQKERDRASRTVALGKEIQCRWHVAPKKWESATFECEIGGQSYLLEIEPYREIDGKPKLDPKLVKLGYEAFAEAWAMWKWHTARGSEIDEASDSYILDCDPPVFVWEEVRKKPGPKPKEQVAA